MGEANMDVHYLQCHGRLLEVKGSVHSFDRVRLHHITEFAIGEWVIVPITLVSTLNADAFRNRARMRC